jgi:NADPH oxidase 1
MAQEAMGGAEKDPKTGINYGDFKFVEIDPVRSSTTLPTSITLPQVRIDGPYGAPAADVFNHEVAVLIGAGIGKINL